jgi:uncharacterized RDD family membrane protein YckC
MLAFAEQGAFAGETLVWRNGFESWRPWHVAEPELKNEFQTETIKQVIEEKILPQLTKVEAKYASFWQRLGAFAIDLIAIQFIFVLLSPLHSLFGIKAASQLTPEELMPAVFLFSGIFFVYNVFFVKNFSGTPGKIALRLAVVRSGGKAMTWGCAAIRTVAEFFSSSLFCIGYLLAAFDIERRAFHDFIADTRVLKIESIN